MRKKDQRRVNSSGDDGDEQRREKRTFPRLQHVQGRVQQVLQIEPVDEFKESSYTRQHL